MVRDERRGHLIGPRRRLHDRGSQPAGAPGSGLRRGGGAAGRRAARPVKFIMKLLTTLYLAGPSDHASAAPPSSFFFSSASSSFGLGKLSRNAGGRDSTSFVM